MKSQITSEIVKLEDVVGVLPPPRKRKAKNRTRIIETYSAQDVIITWLEENEIDCLDDELIDDLIGRFNV